MDNIPNLKYKTTMCQKWEAKQPCSKGLSCYFAHGPEELRSVQQNQQIIGYRNHYYKAFNQQYNVPSNYKTIKCKFYSKGLCQLGESCTFYHSQQQKRSNAQTLINNTQSISDWYSYPQYEYTSYYFNGPTEANQTEDPIQEQLQKKAESSVQEESDKLKDSGNTDLSSSIDI